jgi:hypothetical protein
MKNDRTGTALTKPNGNGILGRTLCSGYWPTNTDLLDCVWLFAEESANRLRFN